MKYLSSAIVFVWTFAIVLALGELYLARASAETAWVETPFCLFEDGNPDGKTCLWIDPGTGQGYVSLSTNYR